MAVDLEQQKPFWRRHLLVTGFVVLLLVNVALQLLDQGYVAEWIADAPEQWAYVLCFLLVWFDAVIPIFPGETTLSAASTLAAEGSLELELVMLAGALGAIVGDSSLFWIARKNADKVQGQLDKALQNSKIRAGWDALDRSPGLLIIAGRYVPGMRFAVNASMGLSDIPYRRFLLWSVIGGVMWSVYTCALAYNVATTLSGFPLASLIISSLITSAALAAIYFVDRRRRRGAETAETLDEPAIPSSTVDLTSEDAR
jgi:membrane-associated protein